MFFKRLNSDKEILHETDISTEQKKKAENPWFFGPDAHGGGTQRYQAETCQGA
jgi:hypothetical protein